MALLPGFFFVWTLNANEPLLFFDEIWSPFFNHIAVLHNVTRYILIDEDYNYIQSVNLDKQQFDGEIEEESFAS